MWVPVAVRMAANFYIRLLLTLPWYLRYTKALTYLLRIHNYTPRPAAVLAPQIWRVVGAVHGLQRGAGHRKKCVCHMYIYTVFDIKLTYNHNFFILRGVARYGLGDFSPPKLKVSPPQTDFTNFVLSGQGGQNWTVNYYYFCVKMHKNPLFCTKYLKNFMGWGTAPTQTQSLLARGTLPLWHLRHLNSTPRPRLLRHLGLGTLVA